MNYFRAPEFQYSDDDGKTWHETDGRICGPGMRLRLVRADGVTIWQGHCETTVQACRTCEGTGKQNWYQFVEDKL